MATLKEKRKQWLEALSGEDQNSVKSQIIDMTWNAATYRVVNESRRLSSPAPKGGIQLNGLLHHLIDRGFLAIHVLSIRRLMDNFSLDGKKGAYSIKGILEDMKKHIALFTREAIFEAEGMAYDYSLIQQKRCQYSKEQEAAGNKCYSIPADLIWEHNENRHEIIDFMSGVNPQNRKTNDTIETSIFKNLQDKLKATSEKIIQYSHKFLAHAATVESRKLVKADDISFSLNDLWSVHKELCQVTNFISVCILGDSYQSFLATPQYDHLKYIDMPLINSSQVNLLSQVWNDFQKESDSWSQWGINEYRREYCQ